MMRPLVLLIAALVAAFAIAMAPHISSTAAHHLEASEAALNAGDEESVAHVATDAQALAPAAVDGARFAALDPVDSAALACVLFAILMTALLIGPRPGPVLDAVAARSRAFVVPALRRTRTGAAPPDLVALGISRT